MSFNASPQRERRFPALPWVSLAACLFLTIPVSAGSQTATALPTPPLLLRPSVLFPIGGLAAALVVSGLLVFRRRRRVGAAGSASEQRLRVMVEAAPEAILVFDVDAERCVDANASALELLGLTCEQLVAPSPSEAHAPARPDGHGVIGSLHRMLGRAPEDATSPFEWTMPGPGDEEIPCEVRLARVTSEGRRLIRASIIDTSTRKRAEAALRASEEKFSKAFMMSPLALSISTLHDGRFVDANDRFVETLGYSRDDLLGRAIGDLGIWVSDRGEFERALKRHGSTRGFEARLRTKSGEERDFAISADVMEWEGRPHVIAVTADVTERRQSEQRRRELELQLRQAQKMEALGTLAGGIAHDFNNILLAILGYAELVRDDLEEGSEQREHVEHVLMAGNRARDLVRQILAFSRQTESEFKSVDLGSVVREVLSLLRTSLPSTIAIRSQIDPRVGPIFADASQIHQILLNLGSNAGHAMRDCGGLLTVLVEPVQLDRETAGRIGTLRPGSYAALKVSDTGCGMDEATLSRVFDPFFTTKGVGEGTGLGLSAVHGIVTTHGGAIDVESAPGEGSTFCVYFPLLDDVLPLPEHRSGPVAGGSERILFVDDEEQVALLGEQILNRLGYAASATTSSRDALARFEQCPSDYDLLVLDNTMPYLTGLELAQLCREIRSDIPIVLTSGNTENIPDEQVESIGLAAVIGKPYSIQDLADAIRRVLAKAEAVRT